MRVAPSGGRSARTVLHVLLEACPTFSEKIINSGVSVAMNNFFTGAALLQSSHSLHAIFSPWGPCAATVPDWMERMRSGRERG